MPLTPRLLVDDMLSLSKQAAIGDLGIVALPGYVCRDDVQSGALRQVLPGWIADDSTPLLYFVGVGLMRWKTSRQVDRPIIILPVATCPDPSQSTSSTLK